MDVLDGTSSEPSDDDSLNVQENESRKRLKPNINETDIFKVLKNVEFLNYSETVAVFRYNCVTNTYITFTNNYDTG